MQARRIAAEMREWKRIEEERKRLEQLEQERLAREKEAADEESIEESLKYVLKALCISSQTSINIVQFNLIVMRLTIVWFSI